MKIDKSHFSQLCLLSPRELADYADRVRTLVDILHGNPLPPTPPVSLELSEQPEVAATPIVPAAISPISSLEVPQRAPMRPPKPGSVRAAVHEVLRKAGGPMRRADIVEVVAQMRGEAVNDLLRAKVGEVLCNRHDHLIHKTAPGTYAMTAEKGGPPFCL